MSGALIGFAGAIGGLGGVVINLVLRASYNSPAKSATMAFWVFLGFYVVCAAVTWLVFLRRPSRAADAPIRPRRGPGLSRSARDQADRPAPGTQHSIDRPGGRGMAASR